MVTRLGGYAQEWARPGKCLEEISGGPWDFDGTDSSRQLYMAVVNRDVRSRFKGVEVTDTSWIRKKRWSDRDKYALPFNLELNVSDVRSIWDWEADPVSTITSRNLMRPGRASVRYETNLENMRGLLKELIFTIRAMGRDRAMKETRFEERWSRLDSDCLLLRAVWGQNPERLKELDEEYRQATTDARYVLEDSRPPRSRAGAKPKYDWAAAEAHIRKLFEYHGPLSPDDPKWSRQAHVERALAEFFQSTAQMEPTESVLRDRAKGFIQQIEAGN